MSIKMTLDPHLARQFINIVGAIVDEFRLQIDDDGWEVSAVDPANVAMIHLSMPKGSFQSYDFGSDTWTSSMDGHPTGVLEDKIAVGIDVEKIKQFFGGMKKAEAVLDEEMHAPVEFRFSLAPEKHGGRYQVELKQGMFSRTMLLLPEKELRRPPKLIGLNLDCRLHLNTLEFRRILEKAAEINDYIKLGFRCEEGDCIFIANAIDSDEFPLEAKKHIDNWQALSDKARDSSSSSFSLDYLLDIVEKLPDKVWLYIGQNMPCIISVGLGQIGSVEYWLAPRMEGD